jgi:hypothetical protein
MNAALITDELTELLALVRDSDSVELKLTVPDAHHRSTIMGLGMDPLEAQIRMVTFFDTPDLTLNKSGLVVRARRVQGRGDDSVIKLRPVVPDDLPEEQRRSPAMVVEVDAMPGGYVCSASYKGSADNEEIKQVAAGERSARKLFSKRQRAFFTEHAANGPALEDLVVLGPIPTLRVKFQSKGFKHPIVGELWLYPDGSQVVELSTKTPPSEAFQTAVEWRAFLESKGVDVSAEQQTKTKTALEFFASGA